MLFDLAQIQLVNQIRNEIRQMALWKPLAQARREKIILFGKIRPVDLRHASRLPPSDQPFKPIKPKKRYYSDTLLVNGNSSRSLQMMHPAGEPPEKSAAILPPHADELASRNSADYEGEQVR
jgi:hypothetical protein